MHNYIKKIQKRGVDFLKDVSHWAYQKYVLKDFLVEFAKTYKKMEIGECADVQGNYSISN